MNKQLFIFFWAIPLLCGAQESFSFHGGLEAGLFTTSQGTLPFWFYTNTSASLDEGTDYLGQFSGKGSYLITDSSTIEAGFAAYYRNGVQDELQRRDLFVQFKNRWLKVVLGAKEREEKFPLSSTNRNFLWSRNSRPLPGLLIESNEPLALSEVFSVDFGIAHYQLNDERYTNDARVHYKHLGLIVEINERNKITGKLQHFAQWGGRSPDFGPLKDDLEAFVDVFFAKEAPETGAEGELFNAVGNHLGSYFLEYEFSNTLATTALYHEHPFEDGSGTGLKNFPDGVWGIHVQPKGLDWMGGILYEYTTTKDQSGTVGGSGFDNYFNNSVYRSGWTYEGRAIGTPFFLQIPLEDVDPLNPKFLSNSSTAHHIGIEGIFWNLKWMVKSTFVKNFGRLSNKLPNTISTKYQFAQITYPTQNMGEFTLMIGLDASNMASTNVGAGVTYAYSF